MSASVTPKLRELTLTLTSQCDLRCAYCYVRPVQEQTQPAGAMGDDVLDAAVSLFAKHADPSGQLTLSFFGGEPFLRRGSLTRATAKARELFGERLRVATPTNGLHLDDAALAFCRKEGVDLAVSIDGISRTTGRPYASGEDSTADLLERLPQILELATRAPILARMTVTPDNVGDLAFNVKALARLGFRKIVYLPDVGQAWSDEAIAIWSREHGRIGTWLAGARGAGAKVPDLPVWRGIESRLLLGEPKRACGAGERLAAVSPDGKLVPCYRFAFESGDAHVLGQVSEGFTRSENLARFAGLDPKDIRPEGGDCGTCASRDGCTHFCPAQGMIALGDPLGVPAVVCRLMRAQVEAIRPYAAVRREAKKRVQCPRWATGVMATALATVAATSACGGQTEPSSKDASADSPGYGPGVCAAQVDGSYGPGVCPVQIDGGYGPGVCAVQVDASIDQYGPGVCPVQLDASDDQYGPGVCPIPGIC